MRGRANSPLRRAAQVAGVALAALFALLTAAFAASGHLPLRGGDDRDPARASITKLSGPIVQTADGSVLFNATNLAPGVIRVAQITIENTGATGGPVTFTTSGLTDLPEGLPEPLSAVLDVRMEERRQIGSTVVAQGKLGDFGTVQLGRFEPGENRLYRFTVSFPSGRSAAADNPLQGASTTVGFAWTAVLDDVGTTSNTPPPADPGPGPVSRSSAPGGQPATPSTPGAAAPRRARPPATLRLSWRPQRLGGGLLARVRCTRACRGRLNARITTNAAGASIALPTVKVALRRAGARAYALRIPRSQRAAVVAAVRARRRVTGRATLTLTAPRGARPVSAGIRMRTR